MRKLVFLGASGLLGTNLVPLLKKRYIVITPSHKEYDITKTIKKINCDLVVNAVAYTDVVKAEKEPMKCLDVNIFGLLNLLNIYYSVPFIYISSEYAKNPINFYSMTKLLAEKLVSKTCYSYLIIRTLFKPNPWPWDNAFINSWTKGDYVDIIAPLIFKEIINWNNNSKTIYVGTERKRIYDIAIKTKPNIRPSLINEIKSVNIPTDYK